MSHKYGAEFLIPAYFVFGIALVPIGTLIPEMRDVQNVIFSECHTSCHVSHGTKYCTHACSGNNAATTVEPVKSKAVIHHGSTGPTVPPKPVGTQNKQ